MKENKVEFYIREYLLQRGWVIKKGLKSKGEHGVDIKAFHKRWRKILLIEVKGGSGKHKHQELHNAFYTLLGQCVSRMDKEGNTAKRGRIYAFGIPQEWGRTFKSKIHKMPYGWKLLKLRGFLVSKDGGVVERSYSYFLK